MNTDLIHGDRGRLTQFDPGQIVCHVQNHVHDREIHH